jgi:hypothetical protein
MALSCGHSVANRGVISVPVGRKFAIQAAAFDCWIHIGTNAAGDAVLNDYRFGLVKAGIPYVFFVQAASPPTFLSGVSTDPNADVSPTQLTFIDSGASGI